jgi:hypothetical protein
MTMYRDPIVEEVRRHREARAAKLGFNVRAIVEDAQKREPASGHPIVDLSQGGKRRGKTAAAAKPYRVCKTARQRR